MLFHFTVVFISIRQYFCSLNLSVQRHTVRQSGEPWRFYFCFLARTNSAVESNKQRKKLFPRSGFAAVQYNFKLWRRQHCSYLAFLHKGLYSQICINSVWNIFLKELMFKQWLCNGGKEFRIISILS